MTQSSDIHSESLSESLQYLHSRTYDFWISAPCSKSLNSCDSVQNCSSSNPTYLNLTVASQFSTASKLAVALHTIAPTTHTELHSTNQKLVWGPCNQSVASFVSVHSLPVNRHCASHNTILYIQMWAEPSVGRSARPWHRHHGAAAPGCRQGSGDRRHQQCKV